MLTALYSTVTILAFSIIAPISGLTGQWKCDMGYAHRPSDPVACTVWIFRLLLRLSISSSQLISGWMCAPYWPLKLARLFSLTSTPRELSYMDHISIIMSPTYFIHQPRASHPCHPWTFSDEIISDCVLMVCVPLHFLSSFCFESMRQGSARHNGQMHSLVVHARSLRTRRLWKKQAKVVLHRWLYRIPTLTSAHRLSMGYVPRSPHQF